MTERRRGLAEHTRTTSAAGVEGAEETCRGAGGRRRGLAGLRGDAPSGARGAGDERAGRPCGARNKGDAARIDQLSAASQALVPGYQAPPPPTGTAARPRRPCAGFFVIVLVAFDLLSNFARNSPATVSRYELKVLKLQRFRALLKAHAIELRATLRVGTRPGFFLCAKAGERGLLRKRF